MNIIETHELTRVFGKMRAVDSATLKVEAGTVCGLLGPNGAGKSTLLKLLAGHLRPTSGRATVLQQNVSGPRPELWRRMGYVAQSRYLPGWMTGAECLEFAASLQPDWDATKIAALTRRLELPLDGKVRDLSRGHYVRLEIALAMGHNPELLLLDEPTSGLDPVGRHELLGILIDEIGQRGCTVVLSSHLVEDIERMADTMAIMDSGRVVASGAVDAVKREAAGEAASSSLEQAFFAYVNRRQP